MDKRTSTGTAIGKIILIGEHAVVYGEPAIALPFPATKIKTTIYERKGPVLLNCLFHQGLLTDAPKKLFGLISTIEKIVESIGKRLYDFSIDIESSIPPERGMGSSAAVAVATLRALYDYFQIPLTREDLVSWSNISEKIVHGNPSGIDAAIIIDEKPLYYIKGSPPVPLDFKLDAYLILGDTGEASQTKTTVAHVKRLMDTDPEKYGPLLKKLGLLTERTKISIENRNPKNLGQIMSNAHHILDQLGVSNKILNKLVTVAIENGALGGKLTGGGGGGCMIALASSEKEANLISNNLLSNGAKNTWIYNMGVGFHGR
ncbi:MAG: mevalonate kinase [Tissierellia bacterium]|nr:mevalonate kinase [Tissierellia bacterium]